MMVVGDQRANACYTHQVSQDLQADDNINYLWHEPICILFANMNIAVLATLTISSLGST